MSIGLFNLISEGACLEFERRGISLDAKVIPDELVKALSEIDRNSSAAQEYLGVVSEVFADYLYAADQTDEVQPDLNNLSMVTQFLGDLSQGLVHVRADASMFLRRHYQALAEANKATPRVRKGHRV
jgi:hypothetical protein